MLVNWLMYSHSSLVHVTIKNGSWLWRKGGVNYPDTLSLTETLSFASMFVSWPKVGRNVGSCQYAGFEVSFVVGPELHRDLCTLLSFRVLLGKDDHHRQRTFFLGLTTCRNDTRTVQCVRREWCMVLFLRRVGPSSPVRSWYLKSRAKYLVIFKLFDDPRFTSRYSSTCLTM